MAGKLGDAKHNRRAGHSGAQGGKNRLLFAGVQQHAFTRGGPGHQAGHTLRHPVLGQLRQCGVVDAVVVKRGNNGQPDT